MIYPLTEDGEDRFPGPAGEYVQIPVPVHILPHHAVVEPLTLRVVSQFVRPLRGAPRDIHQVYVPVVFERYKEAVWNGHHALSKDAFYIKCI